METSMSSNMLPVLSNAPLAESFCQAADYDEELIIAEPFAFCLSRCLPFCRVTFWNYPGGTILDCELFDG